MKQSRKTLRQNSVFILGAFIILFSPIVIGDKRFLRQSNTNVHYVFFTALSIVGICRLVIWLAFGLMIFLHRCLMFSYHIKSWIRPSLYDWTTIRIDRLYQSSIDLFCSYWFNWTSNAGSKFTVPAALL